MLRRAIFSVRLRAHSEVGLPQCGLRLRAKARTSPTIPNVPRFPSPFVGRGHQQSDRFLPGTETKAAVALRAPHRDEQTEVSGIAQPSRLVYMQGRSWWSRGRFLGGGAIGCPPFDVRRLTKARLKVGVDGSLEISQQSHRLLIYKRQKLHHDYRAHAFVRIDPIEGIIDARPSEASRGPAAFVRRLVQ